NNGINTVGNLADFIFNWRDKRGGLDTLQELMLAGLDQVSLTKLAAWATVYSSGKININAAPPEVLRLLPGMTENKIKEINSFRLGNDCLAGTADDQFLDSNNIADMLGSRVLSVLRDRICYRGESYKITAVGSLTNNARQITVFLHYDPIKKVVKIKYWKEN
ncbi:MAG: type II secretion system protein GspK, partial [bacterium]|nr:type II secretion system protein GspK [bacterium]